MNWFRSADQGLGTADLQLSTLMSLPEEYKERETASVLEGLTTVGVTTVLTVKPSKANNVLSFWALNKFDVMCWKTE